MIVKQRRICSLIRARADRGPNAHLSAILRPFPRVPRRRIRRAIRTRAARWGLRGPFGGRTQAKEARSRGEITGIRVSVLCENHPAERETMCRHRAREYCVIHWILAHGVGSGPLVPPRSSRSTSSGLGRAGRWRGEGRGLDSVRAETANPCSACCQSVESCREPCLDRESPALQRVASHAPTMTKVNSATGPNLAHDDAMIERILRQA